MIRFCFDIRNFILLLHKLLRDFYMNFWNEIIEQLENEYRGSYDWFEEESIQRELELLRTDLLQKVRLNYYKQYILKNINHSVMNEPVTWGSTRCFMGDYDHSGKELLLLSDIFQLDGQVSISLIISKCYQNVPSDGSMTLTQIRDSRGNYSSDTIPANHTLLQKCSQLYRENLNRPELTVLLFDQPYLLKAQSSNVIYVNGERKGYILRGYSHGKTNDYYIAGIKYAMTVYESQFLLPT